MNILSSIRIRVVRLGPAVLEAGAFFSESDGQVTQLRSWGVVRE